MQDKVRNDIDSIFGGVKASLEGVDRSNIKGFIRYFSQRPLHFEEVFGEKFSEEEAKIAFDSISGKLTVRNFFMRIDE